MNPKSYPGGELPGAVGAHDSPVLLGHVPEHVRYVCEQLAAVGTTVDMGCVHVKFRFGGERGGAVSAVPPGTYGKVAGRGVRLVVVLVSGQVGRVGKGPMAYITGVLAGQNKVTGVGEGYPANL